MSRIVKENGAEGGGFLPSWDGDTSTLGNREGVFEAGRIPFSGKGRREAPLEDERRAVMARLCVLRVHTEVRDG